MSIRCPYYFPGIIAYIHSISGKTELIEINNKIVLRNPCQIEIEKINDIIESEKKQYIPALELDSCLLEINEDLTGSVWDKDSLEYLFKTITRVLCFFRLHYFSDIGIYCFWLPGSKMSNYGIEFRDTSEEFVPPFWPGYTVEYAIPKCIDELECYVSKFWDQKIEEDGAIRWFNKSFHERHLEDKLTDLIFGLEQIYLKGEGERSYLSYKLAMRCAFLIAGDRQERKNIFDNIRKGYNKRNSIIHSGKLLENNEETINLIIDLKVYLAESIKKYLKDKSLFCTENLDSLILSM
ncbi:MAG: hypothetical protein QG646_1701 [Euryarchaeota archaeon]|nr:hypothetical protein [Euryarchaeota archaeon]